MPRQRFLFLLLLIAALSPPHARAETAADLKQVEGQMAAQKAQAEVLAAQQQDAAQDISTLRDQLVDATAALQNKQSEADDLSDKLEDLAKVRDAKNAELTKARERLGILTDAILQLSREPPLTMLLQNHPTDDYVHRSILLRAMLPRLQDEITTIARELSELADLEREAAEQQRLVSAAKQNLEWQRANLDQLIKARRGLLAKTTAERSAIARELVALTAEAQDLRQLMAKVSRARGLPQNILSNPKNLKAGMKLPVTGKVLHHFGARDSDGVLSQGLTFVAASDSPVVAPRGGRVVFVGPFKGYGQVVILQHGGGYHSFLAGFGQTDVELGQDVAAGEPLGHMPTSTARPELYFEWRHQGEPIDPMTAGK